MRTMCEIFGPAKGYINMYWTCRYPLPLIILNITKEVATVSSLYSCHKNSSCRGPSSMTAASLLP